MAFQWGPWAKDMLTCLTELSSSEPDKSTQYLYC